MRRSHLAFTLASAWVAVADNVCVSPTKVFTAKVNLFAGELGTFNLPTTVYFKEIVPCVVFCLTQQVFYNFRLLRV